MYYKTETVTRFQEGASFEDIENGDAYETAYLVYAIHEDDNGDIDHMDLIWDTTNYENVMQYFE